MKRLHALDALRGVAALSVVVWHWQHFYALTGDWQPGWQRSAQPLFWALKPLYEAGWAAVDLFFALSGFVFFWLYAQAIGSGRTGGVAFARRRVARLYPLFVVTWVLAAVLQYWFWRRTGQYFIFESGDAVRFAAGLAMAQQWLPPNAEQVFNGPAWSVSVEVLLYILFFAACRLGLTGPRAALGIALGAAALFAAGANEYILRGVMGFFLGGAVFHGFAWARTRRDAPAIVRVLCVLALLAWGVAAAEVYGGWLHMAALRLAQALPPGAARFYDARSDDLFLLAFAMTVIPLTIVALALHETLYGARLRALSFLGDISYSTYLLHFPLQLTCVLAAQMWGWAPSVFMSPLAMGLFFAVLIALGTLSHYGFERPLQKLLRGNVPRAVTETA